jgi:hypothetical protein
VIDANTFVLSPPLATNVGVLKPNPIVVNVETKATIKGADKFLLATFAMVSMNPYEIEDRTTFGATSSSNRLSYKANTLIDTKTFLNFVTKRILIANRFYTDFKNDPNLSIRVASEKRISTTNVFCPSTFTIIDGHEVTEFLCRVHPHFKSPHII